MKNKYVNKWFLFFFIWPINICIWNYKKGKRSLPFPFKNALLKWLLMCFPHCIQLIASNHKFSHRLIVKHNARLTCLKSVVQLTWIIQINICTCICHNLCIWCVHRLLWTRSCLLSAVWCFSTSHFFLSLTDGFIFYLFCLQVKHSRAYKKDTYSWPCGKHPKWASVIKRLIADAQWPLECSDDVIVMIVMLM